MIARRQLLDCWRRPLEILDDWDLFPEWAGFMNNLLNSFLKRIHKDIFLALNGRAIQL